MKTLFMRAVYVVAAIPLLVVGQCTYRLVSEPIGLKSLCETAKAGNAILMFLDAAARTGFKARTGGPAGKDENEWFDRAYLRWGMRLKQARNVADDYTIAFAKPAIG